jgi:hypothetical protein
MAKKAKKKASSKEIASVENNLPEVTRIVKKQSVKQVINELLNSVPTSGEIPDEIIGTIMELEDALGRRLTRKQLMSQAIISRAMQGHVDAFREIVDRTEGKVVQRIDNKNMNLTYEDWLKSQAGQEPDPDEEL